MRLILVLLLTGLMAGCGTKGPVRGTQPQITALASAIRALSPDVSPSEASLAAQVTYQATYDLARAYGITDPALIHNTKVNAGTRPRGLCYHWAEDLEARLNAEGFETLEIKRAIANGNNPIIIDHSTAVIVAKGAAMNNGIVIDPWRYAGRLFWSPVQSDERYRWHPREDVLRVKGRIRYAQRPAGSLAPPPAE